MPVNGQVTTANMVAIVTEVTHFSLKISHRIQPKKQSSGLLVAWSGVNIYTFIWLPTISLAKIHTFSIWLGSTLQMIPYLNTGLMRMLFATEGSNSVSDGPAIETDVTVSEEVSELTREGTSVFNDRNFWTEGILRRTG